MKEIPLTRGLVALVDDDDYEWLSEFSWNACRCRKHFYARRAIYYPETQNNKAVPMHREIMKTPREMVCDHINGNTLDNRKSNLRNCTLQQNTMNRRVPNKTGFTGVSKNYRRFGAKIKVDKQSIHLGMFATPEEAARAYDAAARKYFGEYAKTNF